jgi:hypothetical protein
MGFNPLLMAKFNSHGEGIDHGLKSKIGKINVGAWQKASRRDRSGNPFYCLT